jgi:hypothetical protein
MSLIETALCYARQGIPVYAATFFEEIENEEKKLKKPPLYIQGLQESGRYSATIDLDKIEKIFSNSSAKLIGIPTGSASGIVVIDIDSKAMPGISNSEILDMIEQYGPLPETLTVETISGGRHLYYKCKDVVIGGAKFFDRKIPIDILADGSPGCVYAPDWENYIPEDVESLDNIFDLMAPLPEWIKNYKKIIEKNASVNTIILLPETVRDIKRKLRYLDPSDYQTWIDTGLSLKSTGADRQAFALWREWSEEYHHFSEKEAIYKWKSFNPKEITIASLAYDSKISGNIDYEAASEDYAYSASEILIEEPEPTWIVDGIISDQMMSIFWGDSGCGKTWVCLDMIICVSIGADWIGKKTIQSNALIIDEESGKRRLKKRIRRIMEGHDAGIDSPFYFRTMKRMDIRDKIQLEDLKFFIKEKNIKLVLIDALMEIIPGADENATKEMNPPLMNLRELIEQTGVSIVIIHHAGKLESSSFRGSSAIKGAVDLMIKITKEKEDNNKIKMETTKVRDVENFKLNAEMNFSEESFYLSENTNPEKLQKKEMTKIKKELLSYIFKNSDCPTHEIIPNILGYAQRTVTKNLDYLFDDGYLDKSPVGNNPKLGNKWRISEEKKHEVSIITNPGYSFSGAGNLEDVL